MFQIAAQVFAETAAILAAIAQGSSARAVAADKQTAIPSKTARMG